MAKMSELGKICSCKQISSPIHLKKFHDIGVENVTSLYWFVRVMFAEYHHSCGHNSKDNLKEYINKDSLIRFI